MSKIEKAQRNIKKLYKLINEPSFPIPKEMQAVHWAYIAVEFLIAAAILDNKGPHFTKPMLQLTGHAIECSMKACIASVAAKPPNKHDLVQLYKVIEKHGFHLDDRSQALIVHLNHHYYQDLGTGTKFKLRYPTETSERSGGAIPLHSDMVDIANTLIEQAANRVPDILEEMFRTIPIYRANLEKFA
jgi:HEPN domain-containing protein